MRFAPSFAQAVKSRNAKCRPLFHCRRFSTAPRINGSPSINAPPSLPEANSSFTRDGRSSVLLLVLGSLIRGSEVPRMPNLFPLLLGDPIGPIGIGLG